MSDKLTLTELASLQNQTSAINTINNNFDLIAGKLDTLLSRDGDTPNQMEASLDMNSNRITNLPAPVNVNEPARLQDIQDIVSDGVAANTLDGDRVIVGTLPADRLEAGAVVAHLGYTPARDNEVDVTPFSYSGVGDNSTNDLTAINNTISANPGANVNLCNLTWYVNTASLPEGVQFYNGTIRTTANYHSFPAAPLSHPLEGDTVVVNDSDSKHFYPGPVGQMSTSSDDMILRTWVEGHRHTVSPGAPLMFSRSSDGLGTGFIKSIYSNHLYEPRGLVGGMVSNTRYGVGFLLQDSSSASVGMKFMFTDDEGATFTTEDITTDPAKYFYPHGEGITDDSGNYVIFGVQASRYVMKASRTSGGTWTVSTLKDWGATGQIAEITCVKIAANKYIFYARDDDGSQANLYAFTSADLSTTTAWVDSGVPNGLNPPYALYANGSLWLYTQGRRGTPIGGYEDKLLYWKTSSLGTYNAGGVITGIKAFGIACSLHENSIGYIATARLSDGRYIGYLIDKETSTGSTNRQISRIVKVGGRSAPVVAASVLSSRRKRAPITHNSDFSHWTMGTSFTGFTSTTKTADRWFASGSTATVDVTRSTILGSSNEVANRLLPHNPSYALNITSAIGGSGRQLMQRFYGKEKIERILNKVITWNMWVSGTVPSSSTAFRCYVDVETDGGSANPSSVEVNFLQQTVNSGLTLLTCTMATQSINGITWGTNPYVQLRVLFNDAGAMNLNVYGLWVDYGDEHIPLDPSDYDMDRTILDQYTRKFSYGVSDYFVQGRAESSTSFKGLLQFAPFVAVPVLSGVTASDLLISGSTAGTAIAYSGISKQTASVDLTVASGLTSENPYWVQTHGTNLVTLLMDVGF